VNELIRNKVQT